MIIDNKTAHRKLYIKAYYKEYRKSFVQVSFNISRREREVLNTLAREREIKVSTFLKLLIKNHGRALPAVKMKEVSILLMKSIDIVEELIDDNDPAELNTLLKLLENAYDATQ